MRRRDRRDADRGSPRRGRWDRARAAPARDDGGGPLAVGRELLGAALRRGESSATHRSSAGRRRSWGRRAARRRPSAAMPPSADSARAPVDPIHDRSRSVSWPGTRARTPSDRSSRTASHRPSLATSKTMKRAGTPKTGRAVATPDAGTAIGCSIDDAVGVAREQDGRPVGRPGQPLHGEQLPGQRRHLPGAVDDLDPAAIVEAHAGARRTRRGCRRATREDCSGSRSPRGAPCRPGTRADRARCRGRARSPSPIRPATSRPRARPPRRRAASCRWSCGPACRRRGVDRGTAGPR